MFTAKLELLPFLYYGFKIERFFFFFRVINCKPANEKSATKPLNMIAMEAESLKLRSEKMYQAELFQGDSGPGSVRIEIKQVKADSEGEMLILAYLQGPR